MDKKYLVNLGVLLKYKDQIDVMLVEEDIMELAIPHVQILDAVKILDAFLKSCYIFQSDSYS